MLPFVGSDFQTSVRFSGDVGKKKWSHSSRGDKVTEKKKRTEDRGVQPPPHISAKTEVQSTVQFGTVRARPEPLNIETHAKSTHPQPIQSMCTNFRQKRARFDGGTSPREKGAMQCTPLCAVWRRESPRIFRPIPPAWRRTSPRILGPFSYNLRARDPCR